MDFEAELAELARTHPGKGAYTDADRYHDFRRVLLGSDEGRRVLYEILSWAHMFQSSAMLGQFDPNRVLFAEGERNLGLRIFATARVEPKARPATQSKTPSET